MPIKAQKVLSQRDKRFLILYGGRGSGKSTACANYVLSEALSNKRILCAREIQLSIRDSVHRLLCDCIYANGLQEFFIIQQDCIKGKYGSEIIFRGIKSNPHELKSLQGISLVWVEEGEKVSQQSWEILTPTIREPNSQIIISFNPESEDSPVLKNFVLSKRDNVASCLLNWNDNDLFPEVLHREMEYDKANDYEKYMYVWEGKPKRYGQSVIFKNKIRIEEFEGIRPDEQYFVGLDFGYSVDPTACVQMFIRDRVLYIDGEFYGHGIEIEELPNALRSLGAIQRGFKIVADNSRPETISFLSNKGINIEGCEKGPGSVEDGLEFLKSFESIVIHPSCSGTRSDFESYRWKTDRITGDILPIPLDKNNHAPDAVRYALESWMRAGVTIYDVM